MIQQHLEKFLSLIKPFDHLWGSARFVGYAGKAKDTWLLVGGRFTLSEEICLERTQEKIVTFDNFIAFVQKIPICSVASELRAWAPDDRIVTSIDDEYEVRRIWVRLPDEMQNGLSCSPLSSQFDRKTGNDYYRTRHAGFHMNIRNDWHLARLLGPDFMEFTNSLLRVHSSFNGLDGLINRYTPGLKIGGGLNPDLQFVAPLPFEMTYVHDRGIHLIAPDKTRTSDLRMKVFFNSGHVEEKTIDPEKDRLESKTFETTWDFTWPEESKAADIRLFYCDRGIDEISVLRWAGSATILGATDEYFDESHTLLVEALRCQTGKKPQDNFEWAVVRLLNLLGIPAIWYGKLVKHSRPDAVAVIPGDPFPLILLIECTQEKPGDKFATLATRARHLEEYVKCKAEVLPLVFCASAIGSTELQSAFEQGVSVLGANEITTLVSFIASPSVRVEDVISYLRRFAANGSSILSEIHRLRPS